MRIALGQFNPTVGAFEANVARARAMGLQAREAGADLLLLPEQCIPGYPARDLLDVPDFIEANVAALQKLRDDPDLAELPMVVGFAEPHAGPGTGLHNAAALLHRGRQVAVARKLLLPAYDVFDETRYFDPGETVTIVDCGGVRLGITICEDVWNDEGFWSRRRYVRDPVEEAVAGGAQIVVNLSASPWSIRKPALRVRMLAAAARRHGVPIVLANQVGGNDSLIFDGGSLVLDRTGTVIHRSPGFVEDLAVVEVEPAAAHPPGPPQRPVEDPPLPPAELEPADLDELLDGLTLGLQDYCRKTGFREVVLGLSGGIDSAVVAVLAARALGPENVRAVALPSRYTASISNEDAADLAKNLGIRFETLPIERGFETLVEMLSPHLEGLPPDNTEENVQARIRGLLLMAISNKTGALLLTTGNKSELGVGYCTLYGDMNGGLAPLGDLPKTWVYQLARHLNGEGEVIPDRIIVRPPSAELREDQTDQDSLPPYEVLDRVLQGWILERKPVGELAARDGDALVRRLLGLAVGAEFKRRQAAPILKVTPRAFGEGWRFPIAHAFRYR